jgi:hypothetical protein
MEIELERLERPRFITACGSSFHGSAEMVGWYEVKASLVAVNILSEIDEEDKAKVDMLNHYDRSVPCVAVVYTDEDGRKELVVKYLLVNYSSKYVYTLNLTMGHGSARLDGLVREQLIQMGDLKADALIN